jgi:hypothetical protein
MFVKNLTNDVLVLRKGGAVLKLQPGVNCVKDAKWPAEFILSVYGSKYVAIINREVEEAPVEETPKQEVKEDTTPEVEAPVVEDNSVVEATPVVEETPAEVSPADEDTPVKEATPAETDEKSTKTKRTAKKKAN